MSPIRSALFFISILFFLLQIKVDADSNPQGGKQPDVLFIIIDDMNDWISMLDPEAPIKTPHLERLAERGTLFTQAYCASPACNPSRVSTLTGLRPTTSGVYGNKSDWRAALPSRLTIMQRMMSAGYSVLGAGKAFHHHLEGAFHDTDSFHEFQAMAVQSYPPVKLNHAPEYGSRNTDWGQWPLFGKDSIDVTTVDYCIEILEKAEPDKPLFLTCGLFKPHSPFFAPEEFHEAIADFKTPAKSNDDLFDLPSGAHRLLRNKKWFWKGMTDLDSRIPGSYMDFIRAYAACCRFVDSQVGRLLDALDERSRRDNTIIVLWSDHGFHLGEKNHIEKFALWEKSTHVPFIIVAPGVSSPGQVCRAPIDLTAIYPTVLELCGLSPDSKCDGHSLVPLLKNPDMEWQWPALMTYGRGNHAVRSRDWRYIRYEDGSEELYDHRNDPNEWHNLASDDRLEAVKEIHRNWLPQEEAEVVRDLKKNSNRKAHSTDDQRPNILLIVSEDNGPELGCYGDPYVKTPVLDRLAATGIRFENAYVPQAGCSQSRAAFLTGLFPHQNGQIGLATWKFRMYDRIKENLITHLKRAGYRTGLIGKLHVNPEDAFPFDYKVQSGSNFSRKNLDSYAANAQRFFESSRTPFFLSVNFPDAHRPFLKQAHGLPVQPLVASQVRSPPYFGVDSPELREQVADYYNCIQRLDTLTGKLLESLEKTGKSDNTLIIYLGDHGADLLRGKRTSYEGGIRIPLILNWSTRWPESSSRLKRVRNELVTTLDLMPTILDVAGIGPVRKLPGRSLLPLIDGQAVPWRRYLYTEFHTHSAHNFFPQRTVRDRRYKLIHNLLPGTINPGYQFTLNRFFPELDQSIKNADRVVRLSYERMKKPPEFELYDLYEDPYEFVDLADNPGMHETLERLQYHLREWRITTEDPLLNADNIIRLKQEIDDCFENGQPVKSRLSLTYPEYFHSESPALK